VDVERHDDKYYSDAANRVEHCEQDDAFGLDLLVEDFVLHFFLRQNRAVSHQSFVHLVFGVDDDVHDEQNHDDEVDAHSTVEGDRCFGELPRETVVPVLGYVHAIACRCDRVDGKQTPSRPDPLAKAVQQIRYKSEILDHKRQHDPLEVEVNSKPLMQDVSFCQVEDAVE
jgi:hypothetical protein